MPDCLLYRFFERGGVCHVGAYSEEDVILTSSGLVYGSRDLFQRRDIHPDHTGSGTGKRCGESAA